MRAAIYARYSSDNQRPESIDDQVRACRELAGSRGRSRPDGYRMVVDAGEAAVVRRIFQDFADGVGIKAIVKALNAEGVQGRRKLERGWTPSTVSRILKNEKYIG